MQFALEAGVPLVPCGCVAVPCHSPAAHFTTLSRGLWMQLLPWANSCCQGAATQFLSQDERCQQGVGFLCAEWRDALERELAHGT